MFEMNEYTLAKAVRDGILQAQTISRKRAMKANIVTIGLTVGIPVVMEVGMWCGSKIRRKKKVTKAEE